MGARAFEAPLRAVRRRMRVQAALEGAAAAAVPAAALGVVGVYLFRLGALGSGGLERLLASAAAIVLAGALVQTLRRIPLVRAAKRIDVTHGLHDRIGSALAFSDETEPTPFMQAAIADAADAATRVEARRAAPFRQPHGFIPALAVTTAALVVALLHFPARAVAVAPLPPTVPHLAVDPELLAPERDGVAQLAKDALDTGDEDAKKLADEMKQLLDQLDNQELTRKQVFDKLAEIEKKLKANDGEFDELKRALKKAGAELSKEKLTRETGDALAREDLEKAKQELEKLAAQAEQLDAEKSKDEKKLDEKQRKELARSLDRAGRQKEEKSAEEKKREAEEKQLKEEQRKLQRELAQKPNDQELQRKLQRNQRELERLERDKQQRAEQKRKLERLQRELQKAAEQLRQKMSPEAAEALRRAAQQMGQMQDEIKKLGNMSRAQVQVAELKEVLRRAGSSQSSQSGKDGQNGDRSASNAGEQRGDQGRSDGKGKNGKGKNGQGTELLRDFDKRAGGDQKDQLLILGGSGDGPQVLLPLPGGGEQPPSGDKGQGQSQNLPGDGIGDQHDPNLYGDATKLASKRHETRVQGKEGAGPSRSETILGSAEKGFATRSYKRVYSDYSSVVEEVMSKERVPPGYRYFIKRYFQLIKPRD